jgi:hypothetical protein
MKKVLIAVLALGTISAFADENRKCEAKAYEEIMTSKTVLAKVEELLVDASENLEKITAISTKAKDLAAEACN